MGTGSYDYSTTAYAWKYDRYRYDSNAGAFGHWAQREKRDVPCEERSGGCGAEVSSGAATAAGVGEVWEFRKSSVMMERNLTFEDGV